MLLVLPVFGGALPVLPVPVGLEPLLPPLPEFPVLLGGGVPVLPVEGELPVFPAGGGGGGEPVLPAGGGGGSDPVFPVIPELPVTGGNRKNGGITSEGCTTSGVLRQLTPCSGWGLAFHAANSRPLAMFVPRSTSPTTSPVLVEISGLHCCRG